MYIDSQNILCQSEPTNQIRTYEQIVDGYKISDYDKTIFVYHKKQIKEIQLKELGNNMSVFYVIDREINISKELDESSFQNALNIFQGFDEESGKNYAFIPKFPPSNVEQTNEKLKKLGINITLENSEKGVIIPNFQKTDSSNIASTLLGLTIFYGKLEIKNEDLKSAKIHIPLFGQYLSKKEELDQQIQTLQQQGIFIKNSIQENKDGFTYQITITDYEILQSFTNFLKTIEKINKISKYEYTQTAKDKLLEYEPELQKLIEGKTVKLLTK